jgi:hypothetical protein
LKIEGYSLTVSEVAMFLPCLVEKVCVNNYDSYTSPVDILVSAIPFCVLIKFGEFLVEYSIQVSCVPSWVLQPADTFS